MSRSRHPALRATRIAVRAAFALFVTTYVFSAWRLHSTRPQATAAIAGDEPRGAGMARGDVPGIAGIRQASADLLSRVYSDDGAGDGRVSASGLRLLQALRGKPDPGLSARILEPMFFALPASRLEASRELARILEGAERRVLSGEAESPPAALRAELALRAQSRTWSLRNYPVAAISLHLSSEPPAQESALAQRP